MLIKNIATAAVATVLAISSGAVNAEARSKHVTFKHIKSKNILMQSGAHYQATMPPFAYIQFCVRHRGACSNISGRLAMSGANSVKLTSRLQGQLASINRRVNSRMRAISDKGADKWAVGGRSGDCEDFAMTKRALLIAAGWPSRALSLTVVKTSWGEGHAVLSVRTSSGTMVLDNLARNIKPLASVPYRIVSMQGSSALSWTRRGDI